MTIWSVGRDGSGACVGTAPSRGTTAESGRWAARSDATTRRRGLSRPPEGPILCSSRACRLDRDYPEPCDHTCPSDLSPRPIRGGSVRPPGDFARALRRRMSGSGWPRDVPASVPDAPTGWVVAARLRRRGRAEGRDHVVVLAARLAPARARATGSAQGAALLRPLLGRALRPGRRPPVPLVLPAPGGRHGRRVDAALHGRLLDAGPAARIRLPTPRSS